MIGKVVFFIPNLIWGKVLDLVLGPETDLHDYIDTTGKRWSDGQ